MTEKKHPPENPWNRKNDDDGSEGFRVITGGRPKSRGPENSQDLPPDIDEIIARFTQHFGGKKPPVGGKSGIMLPFIVFLCIWAASGVYRILPEEQGIVLRFGALNRTVSEPGLGYRLPWPIETLKRENVTFERRMTVGFEKNSRGNSRDIPEESLMLTGDANIIDIDFTVQWKIGNLADYMFRLRNPEISIKKVAESAMREVVGQNNLQQIITGKRAEVSDHVQKLIQSVLDNYGAGVTVTQVLIEDATVPPAVMDAFEDVVRASQDAETAVNKAQEYRNDIVPRARGQAIEIIQNAQAYKEKAVNRAKGEAGRFDELFKAYSESKEVTRNRLYLETMEDVVKKGKTVVVDQKNSGVLSLLPLDKLTGNKPAEPNGTDTQSYR